MTELLWTVVRSDGFRRVVLQQLMNLTARAFGCKGKRVWTLSAHQALHTYAEFTRRQLQAPPSDELLQRMSDEACRRGRLLRRVFRLQRPADVERMLCELYRHIGIRLEGQVPGSLCFASCFFSRYYTPSVCLAASALDEGLMRGLAGEGRLRFRQRITEGCNHCLATYE